MDNNVIPNTNNQPEPQAQPVTPPAEPAAVQPVAQPAPQPMEPAMQPAPAPQPIEPAPMSQPIDQPAPVTQSAPQPTAQPLVSSTPFDQAPVTPEAKPKSNKRLIFVIIAIVGAAVVAALVVFLVIPMLSGEKTVSCTTNQTVMSIEMTINTDVKVGNGNISGADMAVNANLKNMSKLYKDHEKEMVDSLTESYKKSCKEGCTMDYDYKEGDSVTYNFHYDKDGVGEVVWSIGEEKLNAQEIADKVQKALERESDTTCTQH